MIRWIMLHIVRPIEDRWFDKMMQQERRKVWEKRNQKSTHKEP